MKRAEAPGQPIRDMDAHSAGRGRECDPALTRQRTVAAILSPGENRVTSPLRRDEVGVEIRQQAGG